jgi:hypothetical protein
MRAAIVVMVLFDLDRNTVARCLAAGKPIKNNYSPHLAHTTNAMMKKPELD